MADSREKILDEQQKLGDVITADVQIFRLRLQMFHSLSACGREEAHHLHGQLKPLEVVLQVLSLHREAVLQRERKQKKPKTKTSGVLLD